MEALIIIFMVTISVGFFVFLAIAAIDILEDSVVLQEIIYWMKQRKSERKD